jgi:uncharacterized membrane protein YeaQ/YmgE (transglycosylase-associated protein family)
MKLDITISDVISLLIIGMLAGTFAGMLIKRNRTGLGYMMNLVIGVVGAVIGGAIVRLFKIDFNWGEVVLRWEDLAAAFVGSLLFVALVAFMRRKV